MCQAVDYLFETLIPVRTAGIKPCDQQIIETSLLQSQNKPCGFIMNMLNMQEFIIHLSKTPWFMVHLQMLVWQKKKGIKCTLRSHQIPIIRKSSLQGSCPELRLAGGKLCCSRSEPWRVTHQIYKIRFVGSRSIQQSHHSLDFDKLWMGTWGEFYHDCLATVITARSSFQHRTAQS